MPQLLRALVTLSFLIGATAWGCSSGGCMNPNDFNASVASDFKAQASSPGFGSAGGGYTPSTGSGLGFTPDGQNLVTEAKPMPKAGQYDPKRGMINWDSMAASGGTQARGVLARFNRVQPKVAPGGSAASTLAVDSLVNPTLSARGANVIQPDSIRGMRGIASERRMPRTLGEDGLPN